MKLTAEHILLFQREDLLVKMLVLLWFSFNVLVRISAGSSKIYVPTCIFVKTCVNMQQKLIQSCVHVDEIN